MSRATCSLVPGLSGHSAECEGDAKDKRIGYREHVARLEDIHPNRRKYYASHWLEGKMK